MGDDEEWRLNVTVKWKYLTERLPRIKIYLVTSQGVDVTV